MNRKWEVSLANVPNVKDSLNMLRAAISAAIAVIQNANKLISFEFVKTFCLSFLKVRQAIVLSDKNR